jgi:hypothetical protein
MSNLNINSSKKQFYISDRYEPILVGRPIFDFVGRTSLEKHSSNGRVQRDLPHAAGKINRPLHFKVKIS